jgi:NNP family nitrate/nitrite transporter-like MFS transporter
VLQVQFATDFATPIRAAYLTFLGPLLGSLIRPVGGVLADRFGGARVTLWNFAAMVAGASVVLIASLQRSLALFLIGFIVLFALTGVGNGSTYKMIPAIFRARARDYIAQGADAEMSERKAQRMSRALIGIAGAVGAFGGVLVNLAFRQSFLSYRTGNAAYLGFIALYAVCGCVTWLAYIRPSRTRLIGV